MSALGSAVATDPIGTALLDATRPIFARAIWAWFDANQTRRLFSKWGFIPITIGAFRPLIEEIAGSDPAAAIPLSP